MDLDLFLLRLLWYIPFSFWTFTTLNKKFYGAEDKYISYARVGACNQIVCDMCGPPVCEAVSCTLRGNKVRQQIKKEYVSFLA